MAPPAVVGDGRRTAALVLGAAAAPLAVGAALPRHLADDGTVLCPLRATLGIPCPLCGATRAFVAAGHGDAGFLALNGWWVLLSAGAVLVAALALLAGRGSQPWSRASAALRTSPRLSLLALALVAAPGWAWALVQHEEVLA